MRLIGNRLRKIRQERGMSQTDLAKRIETSPSQISMIESDESGASLRTAIACAQVLDTSMDYLVGFCNDPAPPMLLKQQRDSAMARLFDIDPALADTRRVPYDSDDESEFVRINQIIASAGHGVFVIHERVVGERPFARDWLQAEKLRPDRCRIIKVHGESMEPTLLDGAEILVNLESTKRRHDRIFVIRIDDELVVKRLLREPGGMWFLKSDNPNKESWPTRTCPAEAEIVGEVRWMGRSFR